MLLTEDQVKMAVQEYLERAGWSVSIAWGQINGIDIQAHRQHEHLYLEATGEAADPAEQVRLFIEALGKLVQRLQEPSAAYGLALPDTSAHRGLVQNLPPLAWQRLSMVIFFVSRDWVVSDVLIQPISG